MQFQSLMAYYQNPTIALFLNCFSPATYGMDWKSFVCIQIPHWSCWIQLLFAWASNFIISPTRHALLSRQKSSSEKCKHASTDKQNNSLSRSQEWSGKPKIQRGKTKTLVHCESSFTWDLLNITFLMMSRTRSGNLAQPIHTQLSLWVLSMLLYLWRTCTHIILTRGSLNIAHPRRVTQEPAARRLWSKWRT